MKEIAKKNIIIHILRILYCYTSQKYPVTQTHLCDYLNDIGIACDRKTVGRNLKYLIEAGLPVFRKHGKAGRYYYVPEQDTFFVRDKKLQEKNL